MKFINTFQLFYKPYRNLTETFKALEIFNIPGHELFFEILEKVSWIELSPKKWNHILTVPGPGLKENIQTAVLEYITPVLLTFTKGVENGWYSGMHTLVWFDKFIGETFFRNETLDEAEEGSAEIDLLEGEILNLEDKEDNENKNEAENERTVKVESTNLKTP